ncbi:MAG: hypothetical protein AAF645_07045 [Myxococcota bacterium]
MKVRVKHIIRKLLPAAGRVVLYLAATACAGSDVEPIDAAPTDARPDAHRARDTRQLPDAPEPDARPPTLTDSGADTAIDAAEPDGGVPSCSANWIRSELADARRYTGLHRRAFIVETPAIVDEADICCAERYALRVRNYEGPPDLRAGFVNVRITDLVVDGRFGAAIGTSRDHPGGRLFLSNVHVAPHWPAWQSYGTTNYDGLVLDGSESVYAEDLTIVDYNADAALDIKAPVAEFVRLRVDGPGHRPLRFWGRGPYYLVESSLRNPRRSTLLWFQDCEGAELRVFATSFEGRPIPSAEQVECERGTTPTIVALATDPRETGEMHPMFGPCAR